MNLGAKNNGKRNVWRTGRFRRFRIPIHSGGANLSLEEARERPGRRSGRSDKESGAESREEVGSEGRERRRREPAIPGP